MPKHLQKFTVGALALAVAAVAVQPAAAASRRGETAAKIGVESQTTVITDCGQSVGSRVTTSNTLVSTSSTSFVTLRSTSLVVPTGQSRCVKVLFTAETSCGQSSAIDECYVRATDNGVEMDPQGLGTQAMDSETIDPAGHAYEWVRRVGPGNHTFRIQVRVRDSRTDFFLDEWTFDVQNYR